MTSPTVRAANGRSRSSSRVASRIRRRASSDGTRGDRCDIVSQSMESYCDTMSQYEPNTHITLPDGRTLSYLLAGADSGPVVTVVDGPCSRGLGRALAATARGLGIRLVIPDRPGCHGSTPKPGRTVADWPADHLALMDALDVDRFGIVTQSGGTPYGISVAGAVPERVTAHSLLGAIAPLAEKAQWRAAGKDMKMAAILSRPAPFLLRSGVKQRDKK